MRPPLDLRQPSEDTGLACLSTNLLYMFEKVPEATIDWAYRELYRLSEDGQIWPAHLQLLCLENGLEVTSVGPYDGERFITEGLAYMQSFYQEEWENAPGIWDAFWANYPVAAQQKRHHSWMQRLAAFNSYNCNKVLPELQHIDQGLADGRVVLIATKLATQTSIHWSMVYGFQHGNYLIYYPTPYGGSNFLEIKRDIFAKPWLRKEGIVIVG